MTQKHTQCPDCEVELRDVKLIDATDRAMGGGVAHVELSYAAPHAVASHFTGTIQSSGTVRAKICPDCGRMLLYGQQGAGGLGLRKKNS